jgi:hypothetical protein
MYAISGKFTGADSRGVNSNVYVTINGEIKFSSPVSGNGTEAPVDLGQISVAKNSVVDFITEYAGTISDDYSWMGVEATITVLEDSTLYKQSYGWRLTGGTATTQITLGRTLVNNIVVTSGTAAAGSVTVATGTTASSVAYGVFNSATASRSEVHSLGANVDGIVATLSATDVVAVFNTE